MGLIGLPTFDLKKDLKMDKEGNSLSQKLVGPALLEICKSNFQQSPFHTYIYSPTYLVQNENRLGHIGLFPKRTAGVGSMAAATT